MSHSPQVEAMRDEAMRTSCESWARKKGWKLQPGVDRAGPCPQCGGTDRFAIHTKMDAFNCRGCGISGKGVISLVMATEAVSFLVACEIITGRKASEPVDPEHARKLAAEREAQQRREEYAAARYRERARKDGHTIWRSCAPRSQRDTVAEYLMMRGLLTASLMAHFDRIQLWQGVQPYMVKDGHDWVKIHTGPVMVGVVQMADGHFGAAHMTWLDLTKPKGKVDLRHPTTGKEEPAKKVRGVKKGGAIRLLTVPDAKRIVMGEGIETTLTALAHNFEPGTNYWAGVDLGNMSGRVLRGADHRPIHDEPDLDDDECFLPPDWCEELIYLGETDAPENHTLEKLTRGLKRALVLRQRAKEHNSDLPDLVTSFVEGPEEGGDLNDLVRAEQ